jgi:hypothetical protein
MNKPRLASYLISTAAVFSHVTFGYVGNFPICIGNLVSAAICFIGIRRLNPIPLCIGSLLIGQAIIVGLIYDEIGNQSTRTISQLLFSTCIIASGYWKSKDSLAFPTMLNKAIAVSSAFIFAQFICSKIGIFPQIIINPFGDFMHRGPIDLNLVVNGTYKGHYRPTGLYYEPSVSGWITALIIISRLSVAKMNKISKFEIYLLLFNGAALLMTESLSAVVITSISLLAMSICKMKGIKAFLSFCIITIGISMSLISFSQRGFELVTPGTSGYIRVTGPAILISDTIQENPFGTPLNRSSSEKLERISGHAKIDNGSLLLIYYFGLSGVLIIIGTLLWALINIKKESSTSPIILACLGSISSTGAIFAPWVWLAIMITAGPVIKWQTENK